MLEQYNEGVAFVKSHALRDQIEALVDRSAGPHACHPWLGHVGGSGTCSIRYGGTNVAARRAMWQHERGELTDKRLVWMTCGNRQCMNIRHMYLKPQKDPHARFWRHVLKREGDACWEWTSNRTKTGYGCFMLCWEKKVVASRYSWEIHFGEPPNGMFVCHHCDNPSCVRPDHLFLGTPRDNHDDMVAKGRISRGEKHSQAMKQARAKRLSSELPR